MGKKIFFSFFFLLGLNPSEAENSPMSFKRIKAKSFRMGSPALEEGRRGDEAQVSVTISRDFEMMSTEVTQRQWYEVMKKNPSHFKTAKDCVNHLQTKGVDLCPDHPVENVSWYQAQLYIRRLNMAQRKRGCRGRPGDPRGCLRLPTEAEWEYAARGEMRTAYLTGDNPAGIGDYAWYLKNAGKQTRPVGTKKANAYGLHDMQGNVWEWVQDRHSWTLPGGTDPLHTNYKSAYQAYIHITRGGAWYNTEDRLRFAYRNNMEGIGGGLGIVGLRLVRNL